MPTYVVRPERCRYCQAPLEQPTVGRPRSICSAPDCRRQRDALRKRRRRRADAGMVRNWPWTTAAPLPTGGRDGVLRKQARLIARQMAQFVTVTDDELAAIETALCRTGFSADRLRVARSGKSVHGMPKKLPRRVQATLRALVLRNRETVMAKHRRRSGPSVGSGLPGDPRVIGELPEPFSRPGRARGATSRDNDMAWLGLPDPPTKPRITLPTPAEREQIELPTPSRKPPR